MSHMRGRTLRQTDNLDPKNRFSRDKPKLKLATNFKRKHNPQRKQIVSNSMLNYFSVVGNCKLKDETEPTSAAGQQGGGGVGSRLIKSNLGMISDSDSGTSQPGQMLYKPTDISHNS